MILERALALSIVTFSGIAVGGAGYLVLAHARDLFTDHDRHVAVALALARLGFCIMVALISQAVVRLGRVDSGQWQTWVYLLGAILAGSGYIILAAIAFLDRRKNGGVKP